MVLLLGYYHDDPFFAFFTIKFYIAKKKIKYSEIMLIMFGIVHFFRNTKMNYANRNNNTQILWYKQILDVFIELQIHVLTILLCLPWAFLCSSRSLLTVSSSMGSPCSSLSLISSSLLLSASSLSSGPRIWSNTRKQFHWPFINSLIQTRVGVSGLYMCNDVVF